MVELDKEEEAGVLGCDPVSSWRKKFASLGEEEFLRQFNHGFLLLMEQPSSVEEELGVSTIYNYSTDAENIPANATILQMADPQVIPLIKSDRNTYVSSITVGRARNNDIVIRSRRISKLHGVIVPVGNDQYEVVDMGSTNATFVNQKKLQPRQPEKISSGDSVTFWFYKFAYFSIQEFIKRLKNAAPNR